MTATVPVPFGGTTQQKRRNRLTHKWVTVDPEEAQECAACDIKVGQASSDYPCGAEVPRMEVPTEDLKALRRAIRVPEHSHTTQIGEAQSDPTIGHRHLRSTGRRVDGPDDHHHTSTSMVIHTTKRRTR